MTHLLCLVQYDTGPFFLNTLCRTLSHTSQSFKVLKALEFKERSPTSPTSTSQSFIPKDWLTFVSLSGVHSVVGLVILIVLLVVLIVLPDIVHLATHGR